MRQGSLKFRIVIALVMSIAVLAACAATQAPSTASDGAQAPGLYKNEQFRSWKFI